MEGNMFSSFNLGGLKLSNRVIVAPMCQYSAHDGVAQPWHEQHLGKLACSGAGAVTVEATAVAIEGRVTHGCLGLWNSTQAEGFAALLKRIRSYSNTPIGIQLNHAGRKASAQKPWEGGKSLKGENAWPIVAASDISWGDDRQVPEELSVSAMEIIQMQFVDAAVRAQSAGFDFIELHGAHGYLLHSFLSPVSNRRNDEFGGSLANRMRFPLMVVESVRAALDPETPLGMRINGTDWLEGGWDIDEAKIFSKEIESRGVAYVSVSSGGASGGVRYQPTPAYQVGLAEEVRQALSSAHVICAGLINDPAVVDEIVLSGKADFVALGRAFINDPHWVLHAAAANQLEIRWPDQYVAAMPGKWSI